MSIFDINRIVNDAFDLAIAATAQPAIGGVLASDADEDHRGSTTAKASYSLFEEGNNVKLQVNFYVRKSGVSGTGRGAMAVVLTDMEGTNVFEREKTLTVGADALDGVASKTDSEGLTLWGTAADKLRGGGAAALNAEAVSDTIGIPTSPDEWRDTLGVALPILLAGMGFGELAVHEGWRVIKFGG